MGRYGSFRGQATHRLSYEIHFGAIPEGLWVLHESGGALAIDDAGTATIASRPTRGLANNSALSSSATRPPQNDEWRQR